MDIRIVLVEPEHDINVGYCCRAMKNFGFGELVVVKPKCPLGFVANMYAKHGADVLKKARRTKNIGEAVRDCSLIVGTTGIERRTSDIIRNPLSVAEFARRAAGKKGKIAVLIGREGMGLSPDEIKECDFLVTVPADGRYPVLNISHALAIILYQLRQVGRRKKIAEELASRGERRALLAAFRRLASRSRASVRVREPEKIAMAFKNVLERSLVSSLEARAMLAALKEGQCEK